MKTMAMVFGLVLVSNVFTASAATSQGVSQGVSLDLFPSQNSVQVGETISMDVYLDTYGANIEGVDIFAMHFDPEMFSAQISDRNLLGMTVYSKVDNANGTIMFAQLAPLGTSFNGQGVLMTVNLTAKQAGQSVVNFDHALGNTLDSNVASNGQDVLERTGSETFEVFN